MRTNADPRELASALSLRSPAKVKVGAVILDRKGVFAWGWNHPLILGTGDRRDSRHAEEHALLRANPKRVRGATIFIAARRSGIISARPCTAQKRNGNSSCMDLLIRAGISLVIHTIHGGEWEELYL